MSNENVVYGSIDDFRNTAADVTQMEGFSYPSILLSNIAHMETLEVIKENKVQSNRTFPVWLETPDGDFANLGTLNLTFEMLALLRYLRVRVTLYLDPDNVRELNLEDPEVLQDFI